MIEYVLWHVYIKMVKNLLSLYFDMKYLGEVNEFCGFKFTIAVISF